MQQNGCVVGEIRTDEVYLKGKEYVVHFGVTVPQSNDKVTCPHCGFQADKMTVIIKSIEPMPVSGMRNAVIGFIVRRWGHECRFCDAEELDGLDFFGLIPYDEEDEFEEDLSED